jgi:oligopeptide transport system ATP-binding protein
MTSSDYRLGSTATGPLLAVKDVVVSYPPHDRSSLAVDGVSFTVGRGEFVGIAGESGSGKSTLLRTILQLLPPGSRATGSIRFCGDELIGAAENQLAGIRGSRIGIVFQNPAGVFNPSFTIGFQLDRILRMRSPGLSRAERRDHLLEMLDRVGVPGSQKLRSYAFESSLGQVQRMALVAACLGSDIALLLADEPTTSLDVTTEAQVLDIVQGLREELGLTVLLVSHDIALVAQRCERLLVMYAGRLMEDRAVAQVVAKPAHPYTSELLQSIPEFPSTNARLYAMAGELTAESLGAPGCCFAARCTARIGAICDDERPPLLATEDGGRAACHLLRSAPGGVSVGTEHAGDSGEVRR